MINRPQYDKFRSTCAKLFKSGINADIYEMPLTTLSEREKMGRKWLEENQGHWDETEQRVVHVHKQYLSQLKRYELICDRIKELGNERPPVIEGTFEDLL